MHRGIIQLIPKQNKDFLFVKNWQPITFLNADYKLITKSLATRLASLLPAFIGQEVLSQDII